MKVYSLELKEFYENYVIKDNDLQGVNFEVEWDSEDGK